MTVPSAADMYLLVIFFEPGQITFEGFYAFLKRCFSFSNAMNKDHVFTLFEGIKFLAEFLYIPNMVDR